MKRSPRFSLWGKKRTTGVTNSLSLFLLAVRSWSQTRERDRDKRERETREREKREVLVKALLFFWPGGTSLKSVVCRGFPLFSACLRVFLLYLFIQKSLSSQSQSALYPHTSRRAVLVRERTDTHTRARYTHTLFDLFYFRERGEIYKKEHLL